MRFRFLFCPLGSYGYINPTIAIAHALRKRGHSVAFVTDQPFGDHLAREGLERISRGPNDGRSFQPALWFDPLSVAMQVKHIEYAMRQFDADVLVGNQLSHGPLIVADREDVPVAVVGFAAYLWPTNVLVERAPRSPSEHRVIWRFNGMLEKYNFVRELFNLAPVSDSYMETGMLGDVFIVQSVEELEGSADELPAQVHLIGSCTWDESKDLELEVWLQGAQDESIPLLYVEQGRSFDVPRFWDYLIEAHRCRPLRVAASVGRMDGVPGEVNTSWFVRPYVPQSMVLRCAQAAVSGGNTTSVLGAIVHGVPMALFPAGNEQLDIAERCSMAGVAAVRPALEMDAADCLRALERALESKKMWMSVQRLRSAFARSNGPERAADLLERLASTRSPVLRGDVRKGALLGGQSSIDANDGALAPSDGRAETTESYPGGPSARNGP